MKRRSALGRCLGFVLDQFAPRHCPGCDQEHWHAGAFCSHCSTTLGAPVCTHQDFGSDCAVKLLPVRALGEYRPPLSTAIRRIKYESRADLVAPLASAWVDAHPRASRVQADRLVPVPVHPRRLAARGFNQSALVAGQLARHLDLEWSTRLLSKVIETPSQASLTRERRRANLVGAFAADTESCKPGERLILIDDVVTTGETARACIRALLDVQLDVVEIWVLGHTSFESRP